MYWARVETEFAAAHFLASYKGKCENLHGHNYTVLLYTRGDKLDESGMLIDFSVLKKILTDVCILLDHTNLNKIAEFNNNPSAERIAKYIFDKTKEKLINFGVDIKLLHAVEVFESRTSMARYQE